MLSPKQAHAHIGVLKNAKNEFVRMTQDYVHAKRDNKDAEADKIASDLKQYVAQYDEAVAFVMGFFGLSEEDFKAGVASTNT